MKKAALLPKGNKGRAIRVKWLADHWNQVKKSKNIALDMKRAGLYSATTSLIDIDCSLREKGGMWGEARSIVLRDPNYTPSE